MIGNYALMLIATDCLHVLEHILFLLTTSCALSELSQLLFLAILSSSLFSYVNCFA